LNEIIPITRPVLEHRERLILVAAQEAIQRLREREVPPGPLGAADPSRPRRSPTRGGVDPDPLFRGLRAAEDEHPMIPPHTASKIRCCVSA
jgi:hypothetical protein